MGISVEFEVWVASVNEAGKLVRTASESIYVHGAFEVLQKPLIQGIPMHTAPEEMYGEAERCLCVLMKVTSALLKNVGMSK